ncbi:MAG TPA: hypothetical protein PLI95_06990 [Polyangiaceae bacterium]|nr:hypothetical protein [Polyangiaceae bacterium]
MDSKAVELRGNVLATLGDVSLDDRALLSALERIAASDSMRFPGLSHLWAPALYQRNRRTFRTFLLAHVNAFGPSGYYDEKGDLFDPWTRDDTRRSLEKLLEQVDRDGEVELFRKLYEEHIGGRWRAPERWRADLKQRFLQASDDTQRRRVLEMFDLPGVDLDEDAATAMYEAAPSTCAEFLVAHAPREYPWEWSKKPPPWRKLRRRAADRGDLDFEQRLFRRQATPDEWADRVRKLVSELPGSKELVERLDRIHPELMPKNAADVYRELLESRAEAALPYVMKHLDLRRGFFWSNKPIGADKLIRLAQARGWLQLWAALLRSSNQDTYNEAVSRLVEDRDALGVSESRRRLLLLAGVGRELNLPGLGLAQVMPLSDETAVAMYRRFPELVRSAFRMHCTPSWGRTFESLARAAIDADDEPLVDWLASRVVTMMGFGGLLSPPKAQADMAELLSRHYETLLRKPREFARRAGNVLSSVPAGAVWSYDSLIKNNRLARLLFERSHEDFLADPSVVRDLLESPQIHVNRLAFAVLATNSPRARDLARQNLDLLVAALLRKLHSQTRAIAIDALANAIGSDEAARAVLPKARDALRLPEKRYPKERLVAMIGAILEKHPSLRTEREQPRVFRKAVRP